MVQTIVYMPHFLSWVIMAGILKEVLAPDGVVNAIAATLFGSEPILAGRQEPVSFMMVVTET